MAFTGIDDVVGATHGFAAEHPIAVRSTFAFGADAIKSCM